MCDDLLDKYPIRKELIEHVSERELSPDLPMIIFKVVSNSDSATACKITINTRTHLAAVIALYDYAEINNVLSTDLWDYMGNFICNGVEDVHEKEREILELTTE